MASACPFCQIIAHDVDAPIVHEDTDVVCFLDYRPLFKGHVLVCTRQHLVTLPEVPADILRPLFSTVQRMAATLPQALGAQGTFVANNNVVSQSVAHLHVHVVPRTKGDGLRGFFWPRAHYDGPAEAEEYASRIRAALAE